MNTTCKKKSQQPTPEDVSAATRMVAAAMASLKSTISGLQNTYAEYWGSDWQELLALELADLKRAHANWKRIMRSSTESSTPEVSGC